MKCASFTPKPPTHDIVLDLSVTISMEGFGAEIGEKSWVKSNLLLMMGSWLLPRYVLTRDAGGEVLVRNGMEPRVLAEDFFGQKFGVPMDPLWREIPNNG